MGIIFNDNIRVNAGKPIDAKYLSGINAPYLSTSDVLTEIPISMRNIGLTILVDDGDSNVEYWWKEGVNDSDLVEKKFSSEQAVGEFITGATNLGLFSGYTGIQTLTMNGGFPSSPVIYNGDYFSEYNWYYIDDDDVVRIGSPLDGILRRVYIDVTKTKSWVWSDSFGGWIFVSLDITANVGETVSGFIVYYSGDVYTEEEWTVFTTNASTNVVATNSITPSGSLTTGSTIIIGSPIYNSTVEQHLELRTIISDTPEFIKITNDENYVRFSGASSILGAQNYGTGAGIFTGVTNNNLGFKTLVSSGATSIFENENEIVIFSSSDGSTGTTTGAENLSGGTGLIYSGTTGSTLQFRSLVGGENTTIRTTGSTVIIDSKEVFSENFVITLNDSDITFGKYLNGDTVPAIGLTANEVIVMAYTEDPPPAPPSVSLGSLNNVVDFGEVNKTINLIFSYTINEPDASVASVLLECKRNGDVDWTTLTTNDLLTTIQYDVDDSANRFNTNYFDYKYTVVDTSGYTTVRTHRVTPEVYLAPTVTSVMTGVVTSPETQTYREKGNVDSDVSGTITSNRDLVGITDWTLERNYNGGTWTTLSSGTGLDSQIIDISAFSDSAIPADSSSVGYRITYIDEYSSGTGGARSINFNVFNYAGISTSTALTSASIIALGNSAWATSVGKTINSDTLVGEFLYYAYPSTLADVALITMIDNGVGSPSTIYTSANGGAFFKYPTNFSVVNSYGITIDYKLYRSNSDGAFSTDIVTFS